MNDLAVRPFTPVSAVATLDLSRWYPLMDHPVQDALTRDKVRYKLVPAGRRSGKTERAKRFIVREAMSEPGPYFVAAPTRDQVKRIYWQDLKRLSFCSVFTDKPSESELIIRFPNGSTISLIGLDQPQRMEGVLWLGGIIDEIADVKTGAWEENISPALDTFNPLKPGYRAWCWLIGVPDGLNHFYDMVEYAKTSGDPDWKVYAWKSSDILPKDVIEAAKRRMSPRQYRQEYEASFEGASGRIYEDYGTANHTKSKILDHEQLMWMHDQNYTPLSSAIGVKRENKLFLLDEIVLTSAVSKQSALEFVEKYKDHKNRHVLIYGDPSGKAGEKHGHSSDYTDIEAVLRDYKFTYTRKVKPAHPAIKDRQNAVRAKVMNAAGERALFVNPVTAKWCDKGLATVQLMNGSTFQEDQKNQYQHITTAIGYCVDVEWPSVRKAMSLNLQSATNS